MSTLTWIIVIAVVVVAVVAAIVLAMRARRRKQEQDRLRAEQLRTEAHHHTGAVTEAQREAQLRETEAERARLEAERAEVRAAEARQQAQVAEARVEDRVREADRLDPDVDTRSDDYAPQTPEVAGPDTARTPSHGADTTDTISPSTGETRSFTGPGSHRAETTDDTSTR